jgi:hypothetical protein
MGEYTIGKQGVKGYGKLSTALNPPYCNLITVLNSVMEYDMIQKIWYFSAH